MHVLKFGGTSMSDEHTWRRVLDIISSYTKPVVIVSATAHTTRQLVAAAEMAAREVGKAKKISSAIEQRHRKLIASFLNHISCDDKDQLKLDCEEWISSCIQKLDEQLEEIASSANITPAQKDAISSIGEQLSAYLFATCGRAYGMPTQWVNARDVIKTDSDYGRANPDTNKIRESVRFLKQIVRDDQIPVMGGFYGEDEKGTITTLGFEGSDYTASLAGAALGAEAIEIWTDVSGIYTCDPRVVKGAQSIPELTFQEATELAYFGAKVLHPSTMKPAAAAQIPVHVKNIFEPDHPGTKIHEKETQLGWAKAITYLSDITLFTVTSNGLLQGRQFLSKVFSELDEARLPVNAVTTSEASVSVALQHDAKISALEKELHSLGAVKVESAQGLISVIGCTFGDMDALSRQVFSAIPQVEVSLISYSKIRQNLNIALPETELIPAVCRIHKTLFGEQPSA